MQNTFDVLGVHISVTDLDRAFHSFARWIQSSQKVYVCVAPVSTVVDCQSNAQYKDVVNKAAMVTPDGMPIVWLGKLAGKNISRTYGPELFLKVCDLGQEKEYRHFFYGGTQDSNDLLCEVLNKRFPNIKIVGKYAPKLLNIGEPEEEAVIDLINQSNADILWVGLGSPKQDVWMEMNRAKLNIPILVGIGAAFDFVSGQKPQAPRWMRQSGLEWLFRLCCEPKRLWKRYLIGNCKFLFFLLRDFIGKLFKN